MKQNQNLQQTKLAFFYLKTMDLVDEHRLLRLRSALLVAVDARGDMFFVMLVTMDGG